MLQAELESWDRRLEGLLSLPNSVKSRLGSKDDGLLVVLLCPI